MAVIQMSRKSGTKISIAAQINKSLPKAVFRGIVHFGNI